MEIDGLERRGTLSKNSTKYRNLIMIKTIQKRSFLDLMNLANEV
jgi:hypothetical protein